MFKFDIGSDPSVANSDKMSKQQPAHVAPSACMKKTQKLIFFEDVDTIFEDEKNEQFYHQLAKLISNSKVPIVVSCFRK